MSLPRACWKDAKEWARLKTFGGIIIGGLAILGDSLTKGLQCLLWPVRQAFSEASCELTSAGAMSYRGPPASLVLLARLVSKALHLPGFPLISLIPLCELLFLLALTQRGGFLKLRPCSALPSWCDLFLKEIVTDHSLAWMSSNGWQIVSEKAKSTASSLSSRPLSPTVYRTVPWMGYLFPKLTRPKLKWWPLPTSRGYSSVCTRGLTLLAINSWNTEVIL